MNSKKNILLASIIFFVVGLALIFWFAWPKQEQIKQKESKVASIDEEALSSPILKQLKDKSDKGELLQFGSIPVAVDKSTQGKDNPFVP